MPDSLIWSYAALLGTLVGSFLNVCVIRLPEERSVIAPRSRCPGCDAPIAWYDNVPILSFLLLRGRCRACATPISVQYPLVELVVGLLWLAAAVRFGLGVDALRSAIFLTLLLGIALTDARRMVIPDQFTVTGAALGLLFAALPGGFPLLSAVLGATVGYALFRFVGWAGHRVFGKPALGLGDVHMMAMVGAFLGISGTLLTIMLGSFLGLAVAVPLAWWKGELVPRNTYIPLGVYLAMGAAVAHGWGDTLVAWYLGYALGVS